VAFANGQIDESNLSEEVAHIALELYADQNSIAKQMAVVHLTEEYGQFADYYRQKYAPFFDGVELEDQVRKEILGKILAKTLQQKFKEQNPASQTIASELKAFFDSIINYIKSRLRSYHITQLNDLNERIADAIINNDINVFTEDISNTNKFFYSAASSRVKEVIDQIQSAKREIEDTRAYDPTVRYQADALRKINESMSFAEAFEAAATIIGIVDNKVNAIDIALKTDNITQETIQNTLSIKMFLESRVSAIENELKGAIQEVDPARRKKFERSLEQLSYMISNFSEKFRQIEPQINKANEGVALELLEQIMEDSDTPEQDKQAIRDNFVSSIKSANNDLTKMETMFSFVAKASNSALRLIGLRITQLGSAVTQLFYEKTTDFLNNAVAKNLMKFDRNIIQKDNSGRSTNFFVGAENFHLYEQDKEAEENRLIEKITGIKAEDIAKQRKEGKYIYEFFDKDEDFTKFKEEFAIWDEQARHTIDSEEYRQKKKEREAKLNLSEATKSFLKTISARRSVVIAGRYVPGSSAVDFDKLTPAEREQLQDIKNATARKMNPYDLQMDLKENLAIKKKRELTAEQIQYLEDRDIDLSKIKDDFDLIVPEDVSKIDTMEMDARISLDLNTRTYNYQCNKTDEAEASYEKFLEELREKEREGLSNEVIFEWAQMYMTVGMSDEYYDKISDQKTYVRQVEAYMQSLPDGLEKTTVRNNLNTLRKLNSQRRSLLKQNRKTGFSLEIDVRMPRETINKLLSIEQDMEEVRRLINLPEAFEPEAIYETEVKLNDDFYKMATEAGENTPDKLWRFALKHMTDRKSKRTVDFHRQITELMEGRRLKMDKYFEKYLMSLIDKGVISTDPNKITKEEVINIATTEYAKENIASYMKQFSPKGYNEVLQAIKNGELSLLSVMEGTEQEYVLKDRKSFILSDLSFRPDYSWQDSEEIQSRRNPEFNPEGYYIQLKDKYLDMDGYFNHYGISVADWKAAGRDSTKLKATKNVEEFEHLQNVLQMQKQIAEIYGEPTQYNIHQRPQISSSTIERVSIKGAMKTVTNGTESLKSFFRELAQNREDEMIHGEELTQSAPGQRARVIPKYFQRRLKETSDVTESSTSAVLLAMKEAILYNERVRANNDINALIDHIGKQNFIQAGASSKKSKKIVKGEVSNTIAMAREFQDAHIFGMQQATRMTFDVMGVEVNLTKVLKKFQGFSSGSNLKYNPFIAATSATTGYINRIIYNNTQSDISKKTLSWARSQARKKMFDYVKNTGELEAKSELQILFEYLGLEDIGDRISDSVVGKTSRIMSESAFLLDKFANLVFKPQVMYGLLKESRLVEVDGTVRFVNYKRFIYEQQAQGITKEQADRNWENIADKSLYDFMDFSTGRITYKASEEFGLSEDMIKDRANKVLPFIATKSQDLSMKIDGVIPEYQRIAAQRNIFTNALLQHQSWFVILLSKKFMRKGYDFSTGRWEEGEYRIAMRFLKDIVKDWVRLQPGSGKYQALSDFEKEAINRSMIEFGIVFLMQVIGLAVLAGDDDDDPYIEDFMRLLYLRTTSEVVTQTALGIPTAMKERVQAPLPMWNQVDWLLHLNEWPFEDMKSGPGKGHNKALYKLYKLTPLRRYSQLSNLDENIRTFRFYNDPTLLWLGSKTEKAKDDTYNTGQLAYDNLRTN